MLYLEGAILVFFLRFSILGILKDFPREGVERVCGLISIKAAGSMSAVLVEVGSFVGVSQVFCLFYYLLCEQPFCGNCQFEIIKILTILNF